jgi:hypothetical protein
MRARYVVIGIALTALLLYLFGFLSIITQRRPPLNISVRGIKDDKVASLASTDLIVHENEELKRKLDQVQSQLEQMQAAKKAFDARPIEQQKKDGDVKVAPPNDESVKDVEVMQRNNEVDHYNPLTVSDHEEIYWHQFGRDKHFEKCEYDFGFPLIDRWRKARKTYCSPIESKNDKAPSSSIHCHKILQTSHSSMDNFCYVKNLYLDTSQVSDVCHILICFS